MQKELAYSVKVEWTGNTGQGTKDYRSYERSHLVSGEGKGELLGSSDPAFQGDASRWNPEELLLASLSACHMLWFLHLCSEHKIIVTEYNDSPEGTLKIDAAQNGKFKEAILKPVVIITDLKRIADAEKLHAE